MGLTPYTTTGELVLALRLAANMTQQDLAERIGTKRQHISRLENDHRGMTVEMLQRIIDATGIGITLRPNNHEVENV